MLGGWVVEELFIEGCKSCQLGLLILGFAFKHAPKLLGSVLEHGGQLRLERQLLLGACGFIFAPGRLGGCGAPVISSL